MIFAPVVGVFVPPMTVTCLSLEEAAIRQAIAAKEKREDCEITAQKTRWLNSPMSVLWTILAGLKIGLEKLHLFRDEGVEVIPMTVFHY